MSTTFKQVYKEGDKVDHGVSHSLVNTFLNLNFIQFFFERGPLSHQIYQPPVNNRTIDWGSLSDNTSDRTLLNVLVDTQNSIVSTPNAFFPYSLRDMPADVDAARS